MALPSMQAELSPTMFRSFRPDEGQILCELPEGGRFTLLTDPATVRALEASPLFPFWTRRQRRRLERALNCWPNVRPGWPDDSEGDAE